jgi:hypothetical protein
LQRRHHDLIKPCNFLVNVKVFFNLSPTRGAKSRPKLIISQQRFDSVS